jgi:serine protease AprX
VLVGVALIATLFGAPAGAAEGEGPTVRVIIEQAPGADVAGQVGDLGAEIVAEYTITEAFTADVPIDRLDDVAALDGVTAVTPDTTLDLLDDGYDEFGDDGAAPLTDEELRDLRKEQERLQKEYENELRDQLRAEERAWRRQQQDEKDYLKELEKAAKDLEKLREDYDKELEKAIKDGEWARLYGGLAWLSATGGIATTMRMIANETGAEAFWGAGFDGSGIDIAVIDSGVTPVAGLDAPGKVINGPDLSFESQADNLRYLDTYGHGTHMAGIIAGADAGVTAEPFGDPEEFIGMAPGARIVSLKVGDARGAVDVSQVIAAIDWVVQHGQSDGLNIRVLNLSFGNEVMQDYRLDPLAHAVEQAWLHGIVVVVAVGNDGNGTPVRNPAIDPFVIAVGAAASDGIFESKDLVTSFTNCSSARPVDVVAPGQSIVGLRVPGSHADQQNPGARVGERFFKGSGTSQAAAVVSGAVALVLEQRPYATPDQVKYLLMETARDAKGSSDCRGEGHIDLAEALLKKTKETDDAHQIFAPALGTGSLELARGRNHVGDEGVVLAGEQDIMGNSFDAAAHAALAAQGASWSNGEWNGASWSGASWSGASWSGASWSGASWSGASWSSKTWSGASWSGASWSGGSWSGGSWSGASWSGDAWQGLSWH